MNKIKCGLIGTGWMAKKHINALQHFPEVEFVAVTSRYKENYHLFAKEFGFKKALPIEHFWQEDFDHLIISTPSSTHFDLLMTGLKNERIKKIYCEKPLVAHFEQCIPLVQLADKMQKKVQIGFQLLQIPAVRKAKELIPTLGQAISFQSHYLKSGYLDQSYRNSRKDRLLPAPVGGVTSDLAGHVFSMLIYLLGDQLHVKAALQSGSYPDIDPRCDLHTQVFMQDGLSRAIGSVTASRISVGHEDEFEFSIYFENGALKFSISEINTLRIFKKGETWQEIKFSHFKTRSQALVEAFSIFFNENPSFFVPDLNHGAQVQKLIQDTVRYL